MDSTTRGLSFDPAVAKRQREAQAVLDREQAKNARKQERREYGRMLDQIETCYRQHTPPQIAQAAEMQKCLNAGGIIVQVDDHGLHNYVWQDDILCPA